MGDTTRSLDGNRAENKISMYAIMKLCRPKQWVKNGFVFFALVYSKELFHFDALFKVFITFICFCLISSSVYILNDVVDYEKDLLHEKKKNRPIASGRVTRIQASYFMMGLIALAMFIITSTTKNMGVLLILLLYFLLTILYSFRLKKIEIIDVLCIATGFILRMVSGAVAINVVVSPWILICTLFLSLYLGYNKRRSELVLIKSDASKHREVLAHYSFEFISYLIAVTSSACILSYSLYTIIGTDFKYMYVTIPFAFYAMSRYEYLVIQKKEGDSPEDILLKDKPFIYCILLWFFTSTGIIYWTG